MDSSLGDSSNDEVWMEPKHLKKPRRKSGSVVKSQSIAKLSTSAQACQVAYSRAEASGEKVSGQVTQL
jgi:hypothetical protein